MPALSEIDRLGASVSITIGSDLHESLGESSAA